MRVHSVGAGLLWIATAILPAHAGDPPGSSPPPGELALRLEPGRRVAYTRTVRMHMKHKAGKAAAVSTGECTSDLELVVGKRGEDGSQAMSVIARRSRGWWDHTDEPRIEFDTAVAPVDRAGRAWMLASVAAPGAFSVRPDGRIVELVDLAAEQARVARLPPTDPDARAFHGQWSAAWSLADFAATWPALPPKRMGAGTFFETESVPPWAIAPLYRLPLRHELKVLDDRRAVLEWKGGADDIDPASGKAGAKSKSGQPRPPKVQVSGFGASAEVDLADGLPVKSSAKFTLVRTQAFTVDGNSVEGTGTYEWEAVMERAAAPAPPKDGSPGR